LFEICEWNEADMMEEGEENEKPLVLLIKGAAFKAVVADWRPDIWLNQVENLESLSKLFTSNISGNIWNVQLSILAAMKTFIERTPAALMTKQAFDEIIAALWECLGDMKYSAVRTAAMNDLVAVTEKMKGTPMLNADTRAAIVARLDKYIATEVGASLIDDAKRIKDFLSEI
jgi:proteasome component ECM29